MGAGLTCPAWDQAGKLVLAADEVRLGTRVCRPQGFFTGGDLVPT
jgi:hypothetical protein